MLKSTSLPTILYIAGMILIGIWIILLAFGLYGAEYAPFPKRLKAVWKKRPGLYTVLLLLGIILIAATALIMFCS